MMTCTALHKFADTIYGITQNRFILTLSKLGQIIYN